MINTQQVVLDSLGRMLKSLGSLSRGYTTVIVEVSHGSEDVAFSIPREVIQAGWISLVPSTKPTTAADEICLSRTAFEEHSSANGMAPEVSRSISADAATFTFDVRALTGFCALLRRCHLAYGTGNTNIRGGLPPARLRRVLSYIDANLSERNDLHTLAALAGLSAHHFAHAFKQSTGLPPHRYVLEQRMARAEQLLEGSNSILEISHILGFCSQAHFTRTFTREIGLSPGCYRRIVTEMGTELSDVRPLTTKRGAEREALPESSFEKD